MNIDHIGQDREVIYINKYNWAIFNFSFEI